MVRAIGSPPLASLKPQSPYSGVIYLMYHSSKGEWYFLWSGVVLYILVELALTCTEKKWGRHLKIHGAIINSINMVIIRISRGIHPTPVLLPGKSHGWRILVGCSPWGHIESGTTERLCFALMPLLVSVITILMLLMIAPCIINSLTNFVSAEVNKLQHVPVQQGYIKLQPTTENITHP